VTYFVELWTQTPDYKKPETTITVTNSDCCRKNGQQTPINNNNNNERFGIASGKPVIDYKK
jgi:hypothetical protein